MLHKQQTCPLYNQLRSHALKSPISYHVPGHKNGAVFSRKEDHFFKSILPIDVTELTGLDDLHDPSESIKEAEDLATSLYEVKHTFFLVNGSTVGNLAAILATCSEGDKVLVQRDSHKSIINGLKLSDADPIFLAPAVDEDLSLTLGVPSETVCRAIKQYPNAKALILTNPNYYGVSRDLSEVVRVAHNYNIPVIVDEAHGAHFAIGHPFPISAIQAGADIVIHSAHKTLPAMTMGSYLHIQGDLISKEQVGKYLSILQSSSPSYPIMASLDIARAYLYEMAQNDRKALLVKQISNFREQISKIDGLTVVEYKDKRVEIDLLKVTIMPSFCTGYELQQKLEEVGIYTELATTQHVLFVLPLAAEFRWEETIEKIEKIVSPYQELPHDFSSAPLSFKFSNSQLGISYKKQSIFTKTSLPLTMTVGRIAAESVIPYPPGIPVLMEGEIITNDHIEYIEEILSTEVKLQGSATSLERRLISVFEDERELTP
ncbi:aminotransferase class I/II-fold pyridoxal phosphate-dependent enzyme [Priestia koreensis]|uniref:aminotransferase class I/II-fold pyridoxal phosphate-dependent enzyme n=1 Tax=Priestia koreensis TaxID=284581 RepID=UPI00345B3661